MQGADVILAPEVEARANNNGLLANPCVHAAADLPLADEQAETFVERANQLEPVKDVKSCSLDSLNLVRLIEGMQT